MEAVRGGSDGIETCRFDWKGVFALDSEVAAEADGAIDVIEMERSMQCGLTTGGADFLPCIGADWYDSKTAYRAGREQADSDGGGARLLRRHTGDGKADQENEPLHAGVLLHAR